MHHNPMAIVSLWQICRPSARRTKSNPAKISSDKFRVLLHRITSGHQVLRAPWGDNNWKVKSRNKKKIHRIYIYMDIYNYIYMWCCIHQVMAWLKMCQTYFGKGSEQLQTRFKYGETLTSETIMCRIHERMWNVYWTGLWFHRPLLSTWLWMTCFVWSVFTVLLKQLGFWPLRVLCFIFIFPFIFSKPNRSWTCWTTNRREVSQWSFPANMCVFSKATVGLSPKPTWCFGRFSPSRVR